MITECSFNLRLIKYTDFVTLIYGRRRVLDHLCEQYYNNHYILIKSFSFHDYVTMKHDSHSASVFKDLYPQSSREAAHMSHM